MRLFIAISIPEEIKTYIFSLRDSVPISGNLTKVKDTHITLKFLGEIDDSIVDDLILKLSNIKFKPFSIYIDKFGFFPTEKDIKVFWIGVNPEQDINELQKKVDNALIPLFPIEKRFKAHLTLARVKSIENKEGFLKEVKDSKIEQKEILVEEFSLISSVLSKEGPIYKIVADFKTKEMDK